MTQCIICERELIPVFEGREDNEQYRDAGEIKVTFDYGSAYDWMGHMEPVRDGFPHSVKIGDHEVEIQDIIGRKPSEAALNSKNRAKQLASCNRIAGQICDSCFEAKAHLFRGYQDRERIV